MNALNLSQRIILAASLLGLTLATCIRCVGLKQNRGDDFIKPLTEASAEDKHSRPPHPDERMLCIETAKTVAEKGHAREAIKLYRRAEELDSSQPPFDKQLAPLYAQTGDFNSAVERYQRLVSASSNDTELCNNFAWTLMEAQQYGDAIAEAQRGLTIDNENKRLQNTLAMIRYRQGDRTSAWDQFAKAQGGATAHHNLAVLDIDAGNLESAQEHLRQASQITNTLQNQVSPQTQELLAALNQHEDQQEQVQP